MISKQGKVKSCQSITLPQQRFPQIIEKGYLYIAQPPLYKIQMAKHVQYAYTEEEKDKLIAAIKKSSTKVKTKKEEDGEEKISGLNIQRYKGLGEMNPEELWTTTMDPEKRSLLQVNIEGVKEADHIFDTLMGDEVLPRKKFIQTHAKNVRNLDI